MRLNKKTSVFVGSLLIIIAVALYIRTAGIATGNILFLFDNGRDLLFVNRIIVEHKLLLIGPSSGGLQGYFHGVLWYYILSIPFILGNGNPSVMTLFMSISSVLSVILAFIVVKKVSNLYGGLLASLFFGFSYFSVSTSKYIWNPYPIVWIMPIYFFLLFSLCNRKFLNSLPSFLKIQSKNYVLFSLFFITSLIIHFEAIYGICLIPTLLIILFINIKNDVLRIKIKRIIICFAIFIIPVMPTLIFDLRHQFLISSSLMKTVVTGGSNISHSDKDLPLDSTQRITLRTADYYRYTAGSVTNINLINLGVLLLSISGIVILKKNLKTNFIFPILCIITVTVPLIFFINLKYSVWDYYWIGNPPFYALFASFYIGGLFKYKKTHFILFALFCLLLLSGFNLPGLISKSVKGEFGPGPSILSTEISVVHAIYKDADNNNFSVYLETPPVYDYTFRYLFLWISRTENRKPPIDKKQRIIYVILEPSKSDPKGIHFKEKVIGTFQKPEKIFDFPGGLKVEKIITSPSEKEMDVNYFPPVSGG